MPFKTGLKALLQSGRKLGYERQLFETFMRGREGLSPSDVVSNLKLLNHLNTDKTFQRKLEDYSNGNGYSEAEIAGAAEDQIVNIERGLVLAQGVIAFKPKQLRDECIGERGVKRIDLNKISRFFDQVMADPDNPRFSPENIDKVINCFVRSGRLVESVSELASTDDIPLETLDYPLDEELDEEKKPAASGDQLSGTSTGHDELPPPPTALGEFLAHINLQTIFVPSNLENSTRTPIQKLAEAYFSKDAESFNFEDIKSYVEAISLNLPEEVSDTNFGYLTMLETVRGAIRAALDRSEQDWDNWKRYVQNPPQKPIASAATPEGEPLVLSAVTSPPLVAVEGTSSEQRKKNEAEEQARIAAAEAAKRAKASEAHSKIIDKELAKKRRGEDAVLNANALGATIAQLLGHQQFKPFSLQKASDLKNRRFETDEEQSIANYFVELDTLSKKSADFAKTISKCVKSTRASDIESLAGECDAFGLFYVNTEARLTVIRKELDEMTRAAVVPSEVSPTSAKPETAGTFRKRYESTCKQKTSSTTQPESQVAGDSNDAETPKSTPEELPEVPRSVVGRFGANQGDETTSARRFFGSTTPAAEESKDQDLYDGLMSQPSNTKGLFVPGLQKDETEGEKPADADSKIAQSTFSASGVQGNTGDKSKKKRDSIFGSIGAALGFGSKKEDKKPDGNRSSAPEPAVTAADASPKKVVRPLTAESVVVSIPDNQIRLDLQERAKKVKSSLMALTLIGHNNSLKPKILSNCDIVISHTAEDKWLEMKSGKSTQTVERLERLVGSAEGFMKEQNEAPATQPKGVDALRSGGNAEPYKMPRPTQAAALGVPAPTSPKTDDRKPAAASSAPGKDKDGEPSAAPQKRGSTSSKPKGGASEERATNFAIESANLRKRFNALKITLSELNAQIDSEKASRKLTRAFESFIKSQLGDQGVAEFYKKYFSQLTAIGERLEALLSDINNNLDISALVRYDIRKDNEIKKFQDLATRYESIVEKVKTDLAACLTLLPAITEDTISEYITQKEEAEKQQAEAEKQVREMEEANEKWPEVFGELEKRQQSLQARLVSLAEAIAQVEQIRTEAEERRTRGVEVRFAQGGTYESTLLGLLKKLEEKIQAENATLIPHLSAQQYYAQNSVTFDSKKRQIMIQAFNAAESRSNVPEPKDIAASEVNLLTEIAGKLQVEWNQKKQALEEAKKAAEEAQARREEEQRRRDEEAAAALEAAKVPEEESKKASAAEDLLDKPEEDPAALARAIEIAHAKIILRIIGGIDESEISLTGMNDEAILAEVYRLIDLTQIERLKKICAFLNIPSFSVDRGNRPLEGTIKNVLSSFVRLSGKKTGEINALIDEINRMSFEDAVIKYHHDFLKPQPEKTAEKPAEKASEPPKDFSKEWDAVSKKLGSQHKELSELFNECLRCNTIVSSYSHDDDYNEFISDIFSFERSLFSEDTSEEISEWLEEIDNDIAQVAEYRKQANQEENLKTIIEKIKSRNENESIKELKANFENSAKGLRHLEAIQGIYVLWKTGITENDWNNLLAKIDHLIENETEYESHEISLAKKEYDVFLKKIEQTKKNIRLITPTRDELTEHIFRMQALFQKYGVATEETARYWKKDNLGSEAVRTFTQSLLDKLYEKMGRGKKSLSSTSAMEDGEEGTLLGGGVSTEEDTSGEDNTSSLAAFLRGRTGEITLEALAEWFATLSVDEQATASAAILAALAGETIDGQAVTQETVESLIASLNASKKAEDEKLATPEDSAMPDSELQSTSILPTRDDELLLERIFSHYERAEKTITLFHESLPLRAEFTAKKAEFVERYQQIRAGQEIPNRVAFLKKHHDYLESYDAELKKLDNAFERLSDKYNEVEKMIAVIDAESDLISEFNESKAKFLEAHRKLKSREEIGSPDTVLQESNEFLSQWLSKARLAWVAWVSKKLEEMQGNEAAIKEKIDKIPAKALSEEISKAWNLLKEKRTEASKVYSDFLKKSAATLERISSLEGDVKDSDLIDMNLLVDNINSATTNVDDLKAIIELALEWEKVLKKLVDLQAFILEKKFLDFRTNWSRLLKNQVKLDENDDDIKLATDLYSILNKEKARNLVDLQALIEATIVNLLESRHASESEKQELIRFSQELDVGFELKERFSDRESHLLKKMSFLKEIHLLNKGYEKVKAIAAVLSEGSKLRETFLPNYQEFSDIYLGNKKLNLNPGSNEDEEFIAKHKQFLSECLPLIRQEWSQWALGKVKEKRAVLGEMEEAQKRVINILSEVSEQNQQQWSKLEIRIHKKIKSVNALLGYAERIANEVGNLDAEVSPETLGKMLPITREINELNDLGSINLCINLVLQWEDELKKLVELDESSDKKGLFDFRARWQLVENIASSPVFFKDNTQDEDIKFAQQELYPMLDGFEQKLTEMQRRSEDSIIELFSLNFSVSDEHQKKFKDASTQIKLWIDLKDRYLEIQSRLSKKLDFFEGLKHLNESYKTADEIIKFLPETANTRVSFYESYKQFNLAYQETTKFDFGTDEPNQFLEAHAEFLRRCLSDIHIEWRSGLLEKLGDEISGIETVDNSPTAPEFSEKDEELQAFGAFVASITQYKARISGSLRALQKEIEKFEAFPEDGTGPDQMATMTQQFDELAKQVHLHAEIYALVLGCLEQRKKLENYPDGLADLEKCFNALTQEQVDEIFSLYSTDVAFLKQWSLVQDICDFLEKLDENRNEITAFSLLFLQKFNSGENIDAVKEDWQAFVEGLEQKLTLKTEVLELDLDSFIQKINDVVSSKLKSQEELYTRLDNFYEKLMTQSSHFYKHQSTLLKDLSNNFGVKLPDSNQTQLSSNQLKLWKEHVTTLVKENCEDKIESDIATITALRKKCRYTNESEFDTTLIFGKNEEDDEVQVDEIPSPTDDELEKYRKELLECEARYEEREKYLAESDSAITECIKLSLAWDELERNVKILQPIQEENVKKINSDIAFLEKWLALDSQASNLDVLKSLKTQFEQLREKIEAAQMGLEEISAAKMAFDTRPYDQLRQMALEVVGTRLVDEDGKTLPTSQLSNVYETRQAQMDLIISTEFSKQEEYEKLNETLIGIKKSFIEQLNTKWEELKSSESVKNKKALMERFNSLSTKIAGGSFPVIPDSWQNMWTAQQGNFALITQMSERDPIDVAAALEISDTFIFELQAFTESSRKITEMDFTAFEQYVEKFERFIRQKELFDRAGVLQLHLQNELNNFTQAQLDFCSSLIDQYGIDAATTKAFSPAQQALWNQYVMLSSVKAIEDDLTAVTALKADCQCADDVDVMNAIRTEKLENSADALSAYEKKYNRSTDTAQAPVIAAEKEANRHALEKCMRLSRDWDALVKRVNGIDVDSVASKKAAIIEKIDAAIESIKTLLTPPSSASSDPTSVDELPELSELPKLSDEKRKALEPLKDSLETLKTTVNHNSTISDVLSSVTDRTAFENDSYEEKIRKAKNIDASSGTSELEAAYNLEREKVENVEALLTQYSQEYKVLESRLQTSLGVSRWDTVKHYASRVGTGAVYVGAAITIPVWGLPALAYMAYQSRANRASSAPDNSTTLGGILGATLGGTFGETPGATSLPNSSQFPETKPDDVASTLSEFKKDPAKRITPEDLYVLLKNLEIADMQFNSLWQKIKEGGFFGEKPWRYKHHEIKKIIQEFDALSKHWIYHEPAPMEAARELYRVKKLLSEFKLVRNDFVAVRTFLDSAKALLDELELPEAATSSSPLDSTVDKGSFTPEKRAELKALYNKKHLEFEAIRLVMEKNYLKFSDFDHFDENQMDIKTLVIQADEAERGQTLASKLKILSVHLRLAVQGKQMHVLQGNVTPRTSYHIDQTKWDEGIKFGECSTSTWQKTVGIGRADISVIVSAVSASNSSVSVSESKHYAQDKKPVQLELSSTIPMFTAELGKQFGNKVCAAYVDKSTTSALHFEASFMEPLTDGKTSEENERNIVIKEQEARLMLSMAIDTLKHHFKINANRLPRAGWGKGVQDTNWPVDSDGKAVKLCIDAKDVHCLKYFLSALLVLGVKYENLSINDDQLSIAERKQIQLPEYVFKMSSFLKKDEMSFSDKQDIDLDKSSMIKAFLEDLAGNKLSITTPVKDMKIPDEIDFIKEARTEMRKTINEIRTPHDKRSVSQEVSDVQAKFRLDTSRATIPKAEEIRTVSEKLSTFSTKGPGSRGA